MAKGKVTFYEGKQTGMIIRREESDKTDTRSSAGTKHIKEMSTAEQLRYGPKVKAQEAERKRNKK